MTTTSDNYWGMGSVVRGAGGSTGSPRSIEHWAEITKDADKRLRENSPVARKADLDA